MLSLRSEIYPDFFSKKISHSDKSIFIGSCFSNNIGQKFIDAKLPCTVNPFGVLYNPESVKNCIEIIIKKQYFSEDDLLYFNEKWISFSHHGIFSGQDKDNVLRRINSNIEEAHLFLKESKYLYITFGTALVYKNIKSGSIVANCHKIPSKEFEHFILKTEEIISGYADLIKRLHEFNPEINIVFTASPVRHWKDGPVRNQLSKSILMVAIHGLINKFENLSYFPSYEIMMDDLRDYRFYANDLFHPNQLAIDYIWEKFSNALLDKMAIETAKKVVQLKKNMEHRVFYPNTVAYLKFIDSNLKFISELQKQNPTLKFDSEKEYFEAERSMYFPDI
ncbi:MAG: GSCFA domain-containing protein [Bacteroidales bacterium]|nr:GSCFA domain-containing protein [Bacteroidales bacterium]